MIMPKKPGKMAITKEVVPVEIEPDFKMIKKDNGIRSGTPIEKLAKLKPAFDKKHGTLTAANSSFLTDGSAVCLLMTESKAKELGLNTKSRNYRLLFYWAKT